MPLLCENNLKTETLCSLASQEFLHKVIGNKPSTNKNHEFTNVGELIRLRVPVRVFVYIRGW